MMLSELFRSEVVTVGPQQSIRVAVEKMRDRNVGAVVVVDHDHVVGILTDRDVATKIIAGNAAADSPVESIMTKKVITIWDDQGIFNATQYLRGHKLRRLPIIDRQERLVGMLTADDLFAMLARELLNVAESLEPA
ncbi:MAG: CBS domain-containing protein, partial [Planctomycetota bacterium]